MIRQMSRELTELLIARKYPLHVEFGPERTTRDAPYASVIVVERDLAASDSFEPPRGAHTNPRKKSARYLSAVATIYASSALAGAMPGEHEDLAEIYIDAFLTALSDWAILAIHEECQITDGRYVVPEGFEAWPGVVYQLKFRVPRGVYKRDYDGLGRPEGSPAAVKNTTDAH